MTSNTIIRPIDDFDVWKWHEIRTFLLKHGGTENCTILVTRYASRGNKNSMYMTIKSGDAVISGWAWVPANYSWTNLPHSKIPVGELWEADLETYGEESKRQVKLTLVNPIPKIEEELTTDTEKEQDEPFDVDKNLSLIDEMMTLRKVKTVTRLDDLPHKFTARVTFMSADRKQPSIYFNVIKDGVESIGKIRIISPKHIKPMINKLNNRICTITRSATKKLGPEALKVTPVKEVETVNANPEAAPEKEKPKTWYNKATQKEATDVQTLKRADGSTLYVFTYNGETLHTSEKTFLKNYTEQPAWYYNIPEEGVLCMANGHQVCRVIGFENEMLLLDDNDTMKFPSDIERLPEYVQEAMAAYLENTKEF